LSRDSVVGVRLAVFEGMRYLIGVPACLNAAEHALKCITLNGINDKNERVRVAAFQMLKMLKGHRYIRVGTFKLVMKNVESVRREIVPLIFKVFLKCYFSNFGARLPFLRSRELISRTREALMETKYAVEKQKLDNLETKVFKKLFQCFRNTSLIGTTMLIGSMLPPSSMDSITQSVLSLLNEKVVDESVMEPYLEATAQWRIEHLFEIINLDTSNDDPQWPPRAYIPPAPPFDSHPSDRSILHV
uniref:Condensin complex subunit 1 n=1 Tax=Haemonchus placei TaxID=6290 RepID=A0A0N4WJH6_HAEPC